MMLPSIARRRRSGGRVKQVDDGRHMTMVEHLTELRSRLIKLTAALAVGTAICWIFYPFILDALLMPYCQTFDVNERVQSGLFGADGRCNLFVTDPLEPFSVRLTVAGYGGLVVSMPVVLWQVWQFVAPGLYKREKYYALLFVVVGVALFIVGVLLAYWSLPRALGFLANIGGTDLVSLFSPQRYLSFVVKMMAAFGLAFQFPVLLITLQMLGVLSNQTLRKNRSYALVGVVVLVAVITPSGDPFTLVILSIPMYAFYELAILYWIVKQRLHRNSANKSVVDRRARKSVAGKRGAGKRGDHKRLGCKSGGGTNVGVE